VNYCGSTLSPNIIKTREGYLIAMNVPVARTGIQKYLPREIELSDPDENIENYVGSDGMISVMREPSEVFSPTTIASFEGKPVTESHPHTGSQTGMLDASNQALYSKGHMQNVRQGAEENSDNLVADLFITDPVMVDTVERKKRREVSCGYTSEFVAEGGRVYQRNLRGNHIAIVPKGRAGSDVAIMDSMPTQAGRNKNMETNINKKANIFKRVFGLGVQAFAQDAAPEELAELMGGGSEPEPQKQEPVADGPAAAPAGGSTDAKLDRLLSIVEKLLGEGGGAVQAPADPMTALDEDIKASEKPDEATEEPEAPEKSKALEDEPTEDASATGDSAILTYVKRMKPVIAKMPAGAVRDEAVGELRSLLKGSKSSSNVYGDIAVAAKSNHVHDSAPQETMADKSQAFVEKCEKMRENGGK